MFIVWSVYKIAMESSCDFVSASSSDDSKLRNFWKKLWWLPTPHKVRHFLWHACHDILPTKANLRRQKVLSEDLCKECKLKSETSGHLFWSCPRAKRVWSCSGIFTPDCADQFNSFMELAWKMMMIDHFDDSAVALVGIITWRLWGNQNEVHKGGKRLGEFELCRDASFWLVEYQEATTIAVPMQTVPVVQQYWFPPSN